MKRGSPGWAGTRQFVATIFKVSVSMPSFLPTHLPYCCFAHRFPNNHCPFIFCLSHAPLHPTLHSPITVSYTRHLLRTSSTFLSSSGPITINGISSTTPSSRHAETKPMVQMGPTTSAYFLFIFSFFHFF